MHAQSTFCGWHRACGERGWRRHLGTQSTADHRRIPVEVRNLPPRVRVLDVGLNGVLITEDESRRTFTIEALPSAEPVEQMIYVAGSVETRSVQQSSYASPQAIRLRVAPK